MNEEVELAAFLVGIFIVMLGCGFDNFYLAACGLVIMGIGWVLVLWRF